MNRTWSGTNRCVPARRFAPRGEAGIVEAVRYAARTGATVRPRGTGHSFNALASTGDVLLDLTRHTGVVRVRPGAHTVTVRAGTTLDALAAELARHGLALPNVGTLGAQTVAGALSTANHGTGLAHPPLSGDVVAVRLVTADGRTVEADAATDPDLLRCARTSLGALGVLSTVTLRCREAFNVRVVRRRERLDTLLARFEEWASAADHPALSWLPWEDTVAVREMWQTSAGPAPDAGRHRYAATLGEVRCGAVAGLARLWPGAVPRLVGGAGTGPASAYVDTSHRAFTFPQPVRFTALEHALALERVPEALHRLRACVRETGVYSPYAVLVRVGGADDAPLSPAYGRRTGYVNLTVPRTAGHAELLRSAEYTLRELGARPHWGKAHTATAEVLAPRYPEWDAFQRVRARLDPDAVFTSGYLERVLGPVAAAPAAPAPGGDGRARP